MRIRCFPEHNYKSFFLNGQSIRVKLDPNKPITELDWPEFYDVKITNYCEGKCPYCYQSSTPDYKNHEWLSPYSAAYKNIAYFFGAMSANQKPFQVALGGGNPNQHPDFCHIIRWLAEHDIVPNYTTNGMGLEDGVIGHTKTYCGGVAISCHPHLEHHWRPAIEKLAGQVQTNVHIIISNKESIDYFRLIHHAYKGIVKYFVLLPYEAAGRATPMPINYDYLTQVLEGYDNLQDIAFGANFYKYLCNSRFQPSLYEPEKYSKFLDVRDMKLYKSSFNLTEVEDPHARSERQQTSQA